MMLLKFKYLFSIHLWTVRLPWGNPVVRRLLVYVFFEVVQGLQIPVSTKAQ
jgi:hypothetical protein